MLILREADVNRLVTMQDAIEALTEAFKVQDQGGATNRPRERVRTPGGAGILHLLGAALETEGVIGFKAYFSHKSGARFMVVLFSTDSGQAICCMEADRLGQLRTGAATGVATGLMARQNASTVGMFGSGYQAQTQLEAVCNVRSIRSARVYSPRAENRDHFASVMSNRLGIEVIAMDSPEEVAHADIVTTATTSREPVLLGKWLRPGTHVNAVGANALGRRELDDQAVENAATVVVDSREQSLREATDIVSPLERGWLTWERVCELREVVSGVRPSRASDEEITLFKSLGIGLEDVALAALTYRRAIEQGIGEHVQFLE